MLRFALVLVLCAGCSRFKGEILSATVAPPPLVAGSTGKVVLLSFGYTSCPDVCPTAMSRMKSLYKTLGTDADRVTMAFVSVDPTRDEPRRMREYVAAFDERIVPVRLEGVELSRALDAYGVVATPRVNTNGTPYAVDHTSGFLVVDGHGALRLRFSPEMAEADMAADLRKLVSETPALKPLRIEKPVAQISPSGVGALYLDVVNPGSQPDRLLRVETARATEAQLHETVQDGAIARMMARPEGFVVPASGKLSLGPNGKHVMLFGVGTANANALDVTLVFERAGRVQASFTSN